MSYFWTKKNNVLFGPTNSTLNYKDHIDFFSLFFFWVGFSVLTMINKVCHDLIVQNKA